MAAPDKGNQGKSFRGIGQLPVVAQIHLFSSFLFHGFHGGIEEESTIFVPMGFFSILKVVPEEGFEPPTKGL